MWPGQSWRAILASEAWSLSGEGTRSVRCIVFSHSRDVAENALRHLEKIASSPVQVELLVGGRRVRERQQAAERLASLGFMAGTGAARQTATFLFATAAGEVGIDLDADHMVSDLVAWERMVQRLGRVNRRGDGAAQVVVLSDPANVEQQATLRRPFEQLPMAELPQGPTGIDVSPGTLRTLRGRAAHDDKLRETLELATTPAPLHPALTRAVVDAWSLTSLDQDPGRPKIDPWLRGWVADDEPQTSMVWRTHLPFGRKQDISARDISRFFEAAPPHLSEVLETETYRASEWLLARARAWGARLARPGPDGGSEGIEPVDVVAAQTVVAVALGPAGDLKGVWRLAQLTEKESARRVEEDLERPLSGAILVVDARIGGLSSQGMLEAETDSAPPTADGPGPWIDPDGASPDVRPTVPFKVVPVTDAEGGHPGSSWHERCRIPIDEDSDGEPNRWLVVYKWRHDGATEEDRSAGPPQKLDEHQAWTERQGRELAARIALPTPYDEILAAACRLHDEGKRAPRWQRAFRAPADGVYAKTSAPINVALLDGYRHELGSLPWVKRDHFVASLSPEQQDLVLHIVAAHHGFARPIIRAEGCDEPPSVVEERVREVALRFARLQEQWGPWGLAWWEALLRAADQQASRENERRGREEGRR